MAQRRIGLETGEPDGSRGVGAWQTLRKRLDFYRHLEGVGKGVVALADSPPTVPRPQVFIVRCWYEVLDHGRGEWRCEVRHVASERHVYFREWDKLVAFLQQVLADSERATARDGPERNRCNAR